MENNKLTLRLQTRDGQKRITIAKDETIQSLKNTIETELLIPKADQTALSIRNGTVTVKLEDNKKLNYYGLRNGDVILLSQNTPPGTTTTTTEPPVNHNQKPTVTITNQGQVITKPFTEQQDVVEDDVDLFLHKTDGWTVKEAARKGYRTADDYIAPWSIQLHSPWAEQKIKHIPFHSWVREKTYRSGSNTQPSLVEDTFKVAKRGQLTGANLLQSTVTINRQPYRHVDSVSFEQKQVVEPFIQGWRLTGLQRCGYLIGRYDPEETIPLGITAQVAAIYEPPQKSTKVEALLLKDPKSDVVDGLLKKLGLIRIGFIWTRLPVNDTMQLVSDRDLSSPLEAKEMLRMAHLQIRYPNPWSHSREGQFGSKFVSVLLASGKDNTVEIEAYQMSNQGVALAKEKIIKSVKNNATAFKVASSNDQWLYPDILYSDKDEYGNVVVKKADPYFPSNYFIISVRHGFPLKPNPTFKTNIFPIENRLEITPTWSHVRAQLEGKQGTAFIDALNDFHLLHFLATSEDFDEVVLDKIVHAIQNPDSVSVPELQAAIYAQIEKFSRTQVPITPRGPGVEPSVQPKSPGINTELLRQLLAMGYLNDQATEALFATGGISIEAAVNYLHQ